MNNKLPIRVLLTFALLFLLGCPAKDRAINTISVVYGNGKYLYKIYCGHSDWRNAATRRAGKSWTELTNHADRARSSAITYSERQLQPLNSEQAIRTEKTRLFNVLNNLTDTINECVDQNLSTFTDDELQLGRVLFDHRKTVINSSEGLIPFVRDYLIPNIREKDTKVFALGELHTGFFHRLEANLLQTMADEGLNIKWVALEILSTENANTHSYERSQEILDAFYNETEAEFEQRLAGFFPRDNPYANENPHKGMRRLFMTLYRLHHNDTSTFRPIALDKRHKTGLFTDDSHAMAFDIPILRRHVQNLEEDEVGIIIAGASHISVGPGEVADIRQFKAQVTPDVLTLIPVSYTDAYWSGPVTACNHDYLPRYIDGADPRALSWGNPDEPVIFPQRHFTLEADVKRTVGKFFGRIFYTTQPSFTPQNLVSELRQRILIDLYRRTEGRSEVPYPDFIVDMAFGRQQEDITRTSHPSYFADYFLFY